jgi:hypothetical protein
VSERSDKAQLAHRRRRALLALEFPWLLEFDDPALEW